MAMAIDHQHHRLGAMTFGHLPHYSHTPTPQFSNPWPTANAAAHASNVYATSSQHLNNHILALDIKPQVPRLQSSVPLGSYATGPSAASTDLLSPTRSLPSSAYSEAAYSNAPSPIHTYPPSSAPFHAGNYTQAPTGHSYALARQTKRTSQQPSAPSGSSYEDTAERMQRQTSMNGYNDSGISQEATQAFAEQVQASKGIMTMSDDTTPRNIYGTDGRTGRGSANSYGFPATHSSSSSISSTGGYGTYMTHSVASSVSDFSGTGSDVESVSSRTLPRPGLYLGGAVLPPAPQSMMGQFSSKTSCSTMKKHKCKVCDKRFTRPSSLQTHMYSHTGEKPFVCEVEGCGRHFSVVSNLRRHRKVHKGDARSEAGSSDRHSVDGEE